MAPNRTVAPSLKFSPRMARFVWAAVASGTTAGETRSTRGGAPGHGLLTVSVTVPIEAPNDRTRIASTVPAAIEILAGPGDGLGTRLEKLPPLSSSLATSPAIAGPRNPLTTRNTPRTVSAVLPVVSMNDTGESTSNEQGAAHVHHRLGVPLPVPMRSDGSPASAVALRSEARATRRPNPWSGKAVAKVSFERNGT